MFLLSQKSNKSHKSIAELERENSMLKAEVESLRTKLDHMNEILLNMQRARFGQSSEKQKYVSPDQLSVFNEAELEQDPKAPEPDEKTIIVPEHKRKPKGSLEDKIKELPSEDVFLDIPEDEKVCSSCGKPLRRMGKKFLRREIQSIPKSMKVVNYYAYTYTCDYCEKEKGVSRIYSVQAPEPLIKHSYASPSLVADVMTQKYVDGIPLARQEKIWQRDGFALSRATMANWIIKVAEKWLKPLYKMMKKELLEGNVIYADETVVQVLKEEGKAPQSESRMWVYGTDGRSGKAIRIFEYQPDRSGERCKRFLSSFTGSLVTDGYAGYNVLDKVTHIGCFAHAKRYFVQCVPKGISEKDSKAAHALALIGKIFAADEGFVDVPESSGKQRTAVLKPLFDEYFNYISTINAPGGSKLEKAVTYSLNQRKQLENTLLDIRLELTNNLAERAIKPFVVGRKNWLFCDTDKGADASARCYSIVESAKLNGLNVFAYLSHLLTELPKLGEHPTSDS